MKEILTFLVLGSFWFQSFPAFARGELVYLDPGHTLEFTGVQGACGTPEVWVNDLLSLQLARKLQALGYKVAFSRPPNLEREKIHERPGREGSAGLRARGERANRLRAMIFVSIHHDSIAESQMIHDSEACPERPHQPGALVIGPELLKTHQVGFNVFIHPATGRKFDRSLRLARRIGQSFVNHGEVPSTFHVPEVEPDCTSCTWQDKPLGVMSRNLSVIRHPTMPAVLVEVTNLRIPELERKANHDEYRDRVAGLLADAIHGYFENGEDR
jgi:N-acetylmuramoyl-L-alanine amidase